jgi:iron complex transport system permease protein
VSVRVGFSLLGILLIVAMAGALVVGSVPVGRLLGEAALRDAVLWDIRAPRVLLACLVGGGVAAAGAAIQGLFRNPLADPALIGVSGGAALAASAFLVLGSGAGVTFGLPASAFVGGLATTYLVMAVGRVTGNISGMLLAGIAVNAVSIAGVGLFAVIADDYELRSVTFWALGSFNVSDWTSVAIASSTLVTVVLLYREGERLNAMTLGDAEAGHLGIVVPALRNRVIAYAAFTVGVAVALTGVIAFVGLIVPHLVRLTLGSGHRVVIPGSALLGALMVLIADGLCRTVVAPAELPVGILTALLGGPFFLYLLIRHKGKLGL